MRLPHLTVTIMVVILSNLFAMGLALASSEQCIECHQEILNSAEVDMVTHRPVAQKQCELCHILNSTEAVITESFLQDQWIIKTDSRVEMEWLAESFVESTQQVALLPLDMCDTELTIKLWFKNRQKIQDHIILPSVSMIPQKVSKQQPIISELHLQHYNDQLLSRATLHWETNVPCRCQILYRTDNEEYTKQEDDFYTVAHNQEIKNFSAVNAHVAIQCDDTFQQHTDHPFVRLTRLALKTDDELDQINQHSTRYSTQLFRIGDSIELSMETQQPVTIALGRVKPTKQLEPHLEPIQQPADQLTNTIKGHPILSDKKQINTTICFKCHDNTSEGTSHPINVLPPPGMIIPREYPLLSDGRLTCMTCHSAHSSDNKARLLKGGNKELCTGCHTNY